MDDYQLKETIKRIIREFHEEGLPEVVERSVQLPNLEKITKAIVIIGPRRTGKTYLTYQMMKEKISQGKEITDFLYVNFEDERIAGIRPGQLDYLLECYQDLYPEKKPVLVLDEVQNVGEWEKFVRRLNEKKYEIYVTGSNSRLLSKEISTSLRGRCLAIELLPFSFKEYSALKGIKLEENWQYGNQRHEIKKAFDEYFTLSGFPEVALENKLELVDDYYKAVFYRDVIERYKIKNTELMRLFMQYLVNNYSQAFSVNKFNNFAKSNGYTSSTSVIHSYARILEDVYYCFFMGARLKSAKKQTSYFKKTYLSDQGFINHYVTEKDKGRMLENIVFLELYRRGAKPAYYKDGAECDFVTQDSAIQVTYALEENNKKWEIDGAIHATERFNTKHAIIITYGQEDQIKTHDTTIRVIPIWKWLLQK
ncbi:ATP-binding protein [Candidatus Micrarchaeota archaeon]|nr:ATP-binding protein [Candidatus Micrarchaeota archaeon]